MLGNWTGGKKNCRRKILKVEKMLELSQRFTFLQDSNAKLAARATVSWSGVEKKLIHVLK